METVSSTTQASRPSVTSRDAENAVRTLLRYIGEDPDREGLLDTPGRVVRSWQEMTGGVLADPSRILATQFNEQADEMVVLRDINFVSLCEHHVLPFSGTVDVAYLPGPRVVGLSKLARLVDCYARRLQIQERLTKQVAETLYDQTGAKGVGVIVKASHSCMTCRGVRKSSGEMVTSCLLGCFRDPGARSEFLRLTAT